MAETFIHGIEVIQFDDGARGGSGGGGSVPVPLPAMVLQHPESRAVMDGATALLVASFARALIIGWQRSVVPDVWTDIGGASMPSYTTPALQLVNSGVQYRAFAIGPDGVRVYTDAATITVESDVVPAPVNTRAPAVTGLARVGEILTLDRGDWTGAQTLVSQLLRGVAPIPGVTGLSYEVDEADEGSQLMLRVTATAADGTTTTTALSAATAVVQGIPVPVFTLQPQNKTVRDGKTFAMSWDADNAVSYQVQVRANGSGAWSNVGGEITTKSYTSGALALAMDGRQYSVLATPANGPQVRSAVATVTMVPATLLTFDATTTAALDGATTEADWYAALMAALSGGDRTLTIKRAASGDPWAGTTVFQGTVSGAMSIGPDGLLPGDITDQSVGIGADLATGVAAWRLERAGRYVQGRFGLEASANDWGVPQSLPDGTSEIYGLTFDGCAIAAPPYLP